MNVEKNICESRICTMVGLDKKNKDTEYTRQDLVDMNIRLELPLRNRRNGTQGKSRVSYTLGLKEKDGFYQYLKSIKHPDGYAANLSRCVASKNGRLSGLKSHVYHVLLQCLFPIGMRGYMNKEICTTLFELGSFFEGICSKTLKWSHVEELENKIVLILCKLERIFPPAFFDVMVHLAVHLPREATLAGPVQYRWMYPIER